MAGRTPAELDVATADALTELVLSDDPDQARTGRMVVAIIHTVALALTREVQTRPADIAEAAARAAAVRAFAHGAGKLTGAYLDTQVERGAPLDLEDRRLVDAFRQGLVEQRDAFRELRDPDDFGIVPEPGDPGD